VLPRLAGVPDAARHPGGARDPCRVTRHGGLPCGSRQIPLVREGPDQVSLWAGRAAFLQRPSTARSPHETSLDDDHGRRPAGRVRREEPGHPQPAGDSADGLPAE
jgi:hypothetical protein